jgi:hypothetical protein
MRAHEFVHSWKGKNRVVAPWVGELISTAREERSKVTPCRVIQSTTKMILMPSIAKRIKSVLMILLPNLIGTFLMSLFEEILPPGVAIIYDLLV